ncbi:MAG: hypothetical protein BalsKO_01090 [Balneolaceae bacterium]
MKKALLGIFFSFLCIPLLAQNESIAPELLKAELITFLQGNYSVSNPLGYNSARDAMYGSIDNKNGDIVCVYTGFTITANTRGDAFSKGINTEHTWPQGMFDSDEPMRGDIHHLFPTLVEVNSERSNDPFGEIPDNETTSWWYLNNKGSQTSIPDSNIDLYSEEVSGKFEPREDHKGNVARAIFYFWAIYQNTNDVSDDASFFNGMKDVLLTWHDKDPVDEAEVARSLGAEQAQGNRNPFIHDTTLVRRAFFDGDVIQPDPVPNPVVGKITEIEEMSFDLTYVVDDKERTIEFTYTSELSTIDTADTGFNLTDYESIEEAEVNWEEGEEQSELRALSIEVIDFGETIPDTIITGPAASFDALIISGVMDGTLSGGTPKTVELYASEDIPDLGVFGLGSASNGGGTDGVEFTLSGSVPKGDFIYIATENTNFNVWFGFSNDLTDDFSVAINGDDALELFYDSTKAFSGNEIVVDTFGEINIDGSGTSWEYTDGWAYRVDFTGPDSTSFNISNWTFSGVDALESESTNSLAQNPFPVGTYKFKMETSVNRENEIPNGVILHQNYPNPFNPSTQISYTLNKPALVTLKVFDITGREISVLERNRKVQGHHVVNFDASNLSSGVYIYQLSVGEVSITEKMLLIK